MELLKVEKLEVAQKKLFDKCIDSRFCIKEKTVDILDCLNFILSKDVYASIDVPTFRRSTVDGYAVISSDVSGASESVPCFLDIVGESLMGDECTHYLKSGECMYVPTGGMIPEGADAMIMVEWTEKFTDNKLSVYKSIASGNNVVNIGDDNKKGDLLLKKGRKLSPSDMGLLSSNGIKEVDVYDSLNVAIISTGDEVADISSEKKVSQVYDINTYTIFGECKKNKFNVNDKCLIKDDEKILYDTLKSMMQKNDVVVISGGSSKGKKDNTAKVIGDLCSSGVMTHGIAVKPGKPTIIGYDDSTKTIVIGLPGHPVASLLLFRLLVVNLYEKLTGADIYKVKVKGKMCENIVQSPGRTTFQLVTIDEDYNVHLVLGKSGLINTLAKADGYIVINDNVEGVNVGDIVDVYLLD